jgi:hypothetical protein
VAINSGVDETILVADFITSSGCRTTSDFREKSKTFGNSLGVNNQV